MADNSQYMEKVANYHGCDSEGNRLVARIECVLAYHIIGNHKVVKDNYWFRIYNKVQEVDERIYPANDAKKWMAYKASEASRVVNLILKDPKRTTYKDFSRYIDQMIESLQYQQNRHIWKDRKNAFAEDIKNLLDKYGFTLRAYDCSGYESPCGYSIRIIHKIDDQEFEEDITDLLSLEIE